MIENTPKEAKRLRNKATSEIRKLLPRQPYAIGIYKDVRKLGYSGQHVTYAMRMITQEEQYQAKLKSCLSRYDIADKPVGRDADDLEASGVIVSPTHTKAPEEAVREPVVRIKKRRTLSLRG